jgi:hypothetical protein
MKVIRFTRFEVEKYLNEFVSTIKTNGLDGDVVYDLVKLKIELTKEVSKIAEFRKTLISTVNAPDGWDAIKAKVDSKEELTEEEQVLRGRLEAIYNEELSKVALPFFNEVLTIPFNGISEDDFKAIVKNKELDSVFGYEYLYNKLVDVTDEEAEILEAEEAEEAEDRGQYVAKIGDATEAEEVA